jgi:hypothetical protein
MFYSEQSQEDCLETCRKDDPRNVYEDDHSGSWADGCDDKCSEELTNGLQASLVSAALAVPVIGILNYGFGWLRRPLNADLMTKSGETLDSLEEQDREKQEAAEKEIAESREAEQTGAPKHDPGSSTHTESAPNQQNMVGGDDTELDEHEHTAHKQSVVRARRGHLCAVCTGAGNGKACCCVRCFRSLCIEKPLSCWHCLVVQSCCVYGVCAAVLAQMSRVACCCFKSKVYPEAYSPRIKVVIPPRTRAKVGQRRQAVAAQMETCKVSAALLFSKYDVNKTGYLEPDQLRTLMVELNGNVGVSDYALNFVLAQATIGDDDQRISPEELGPAVSLWRYCPGPPGALQWPLEALFPL